MKKSQSPEFEFVNEQDKKEFEEIPKAEQEKAMEIFEKENKNENITSFPTVVDYNMPVKELLQSITKYRSYNIDIENPEFQKRTSEKKGKINIDIKIVKYKGEKQYDKLKKRGIIPYAFDGFGSDAGLMMPVEIVLKDFEQKGLRPVELHEILAFGIQHPEELKKYHIIALGDNCGKMDDDKFPRLVSLDAVSFNWGYYDLDKLGGGASYAAVSKEPQEKTKK